MNIPENIGVNNIQASILSLPNKIFPHLQQTHFTKTRKKKSQKLKIIGKFTKKKKLKKGTNIRGASGVVYGAGDEDPPLPINEKGLLIVGDATLDKLRMQKHQWHEEEEDEQFGD